MKKNGFTLVEIVVSLVILVAIALVVGLGLNKVFSNNEKASYETIIKNITSSADVYLSNNSTLITQLHTTKGYIIIKVADLIAEGLLDENLVNPNTGERIGANDEHDFVMVTLDAEGLLKFTYNADPITESYLEAQNKVLDYNVAFSCNSISSYEEEWGTVSLRLILADGSVDNESSINSVIEQISCDVNTSVPGTYRITYTYKLPDTGVTKTLNRTAIVSPSMDDIVTIAATVTPTKVVINGAISFNVIATDRRGDSKTLIENEYSVSSRATNVAGTFNPTITYTKTNSDGSIPKTTVTYTVVDSLTDIIEDDDNCTIQPDGSCWYLGNQEGNYVDYSNKIWRIYQKENTGAMKIILNSISGNYVFSSYDQSYYCNPSTCCNSGYGLNSSASYYLLTQNPNNLNTYLTTYLNTLSNNSSYLKTNVFDLTGYGSSTGASITQKIGLLSYSDYSKIASCSTFSCGSSYLNIGQMWGLSTYYKIGVGSGSVDLSSNGFGRMVSVLANQTLYVAANGTVSYANGTSTVLSGSIYRANHAGTSLGVRPVVVLNSSVKIIGGDGTLSNPYKVV